MTMLNEENRQEIIKLKQQAGEFLNFRFFFAANDLYGRLLELDPEDLDGHYGALMSNAQVSNKEDLIAYYQDLYSEKAFETKEACEKRKDVIDHMTESFFVDGYLGKEEIARLYRFDLNYESLLECRKKQKKEIKDQIDQDEHLSFIKEKDPETINKILEAYDNRIELAEESDAVSEKHIQEEYQRFLFRVNEKIQKLHEDALRQRNDDLKRIEEEIDDADLLEELNSLLRTLDRFKDCAEGQNVIEHCEKKIEELKRKELQKPNAQQIEKILLFAKSSLDNGKFSQAYDAYREVLSYEKNLEEAHLGILKAQCQIADTDELIDYYKNLYNDDYGEILNAVEEDKDHIDEMADKYALPGYLERNEIYAAYRFDGSYLSRLKHRINEERRFKEAMEDNPSFKWLRFNASQGLRDQIASIYEAYENRIKEAEAEDEKNVESIRNEYRRFLFQTYSLIRKRYEAADEKKNKDYLKLIKRFDGADDERKLYELVLDLKEFGDYKDCEHYIDLCNEKIERIRKNKEEKALSDKIDLLLEEGNRALEKGKTSIAESRFSDVLALDKKQPYAYLGLLMIELGLTSEKELSDHYKELYSSFDTVALEACEEDKEHIDQIVEHFVLPGYLEEEKIRSYYKLDRNYASELPAREKQRKQIEEEFEMNPYLSKIMEYKDDHIKSFYNDILNVYDQRIKEARIADRSRRDSIIDIYKYYVKQSDLSVEEAYEEKLKEKQIYDEKKYQDNVIRFNSASNDEQLKDLINDFDVDYKDSKDYVDQIKEKLQKKEIDEAKESLDALLEKGKEFLENSQFEKAALSFSTLLNYEPDLEAAHLGLAMAEARMKDPDSLFHHLKDLYSDEITVKKEALRPDVAHIEEIAEKYCVHTKLSREQIRDKYDVDLSFDSLYETRVKQKEEILKKISEDPSLAWLKDHGSAGIKERFADLLHVYEDRIREAKEEEEGLIVQYKEAYAAFLEETDNEVRDLYMNIVSKKPETDTVPAVRKQEDPLIQKKSEKEIKAEKPVKETAKKKAEPAKKEKKQTDSKKAAFIALTFVGLLAIFGGFYYMKNSRTIDDYGRAVQFVEEGNYDEAIALLETLGDYKDSSYLLKETTYKKADQLYAQGKLQEALELFSGLHFDDSQDRVSQIQRELLAKVKVGDSLYYGSYEQDGNETNGAELIEWMVVDMQNGRVLLVSRYGLEARAFHDVQEEIYWEDSSVREWLNNEFMNMAFSQAEQDNIVQTTLMNSQYDVKDTSEKPAIELAKTRDKIFLLSEEEILQYFPEEASRACEASISLSNSGIKMPEGRCSWWLRSSNMEKDGTAQIVSGISGQIEDASCELVNVIRPAMWIRTD